MIVGMVMVEKGVVMVDKGVDREVTMGGYGGEGCG